jgi:putative transposase
MKETTCRKTYKEKLRPTLAQERRLDEVLWRCRALYNTALEQRSTAWQRCRISVSRYEQEAELKAIRAEFPEYADIHSHVLQDVLARLDKTYQAFFRRVQRGQKAGFPRFKGRFGNRYHSFTFKEFGNGARLDNGSLVLAKIGRIRVHWSRPIQGTPKTVTISKEADGWYMSISCAEVPTHPLPPTGRETGIDLGLESFATLADGTMIHNPRCYRNAEAYLAKCQRRVSKRKKGSARRRKAVCWLGKAHQTVRRQRQDFQHKAALSLVRGEPCIHEPSLLGLRRGRAERLVRPLAPVPGVRNEPAPRPQRRVEHPMARAAPSGTRGGTCGNEPRTHGAVAPVECQRHSPMVDGDCGNRAGRRADQRDRLPCSA